MLDLNDDALVQKIHDSIAETEFEDKIVVLHIENGEYYNFNATASALWRALDKPHTFASLISLIYNKYECDLNTCRQDIQSCLRVMQHKNLIEITPPSDA
jgi:hypothetical protein